MSRPECTWADIIQRLAARKVTLANRPLFPREKKVLRDLAIRADRLGISLNEIAKRLDCSYQNVQQFFTGQHGVTFPSLEQYCDLLSVEFQVIILPKNHPVL